MKTPLHAPCDTIVRYSAIDDWGNLRTATYPCPSGCTPPRTIVRFGCKLTRVDAPRSALFEIAIAITNVAIAQHSERVAK